MAVSYLYTPSVVRLLMGGQNCTYSIIFGAKNDWALGTRHHRYDY